MSPAPRRQGPLPGQRFPHSWGYWLGVLLILAGIGVGIFGAVNGVTGFADDVNDLRRVLDNDLEASLEAGEEVLVYDEADVSAGPFDVTVIRLADGAEVSTSNVEDGTTYDVDGRRGQARVGFRVPTSDIYRIEVDTSVGQIARFAVGADVGNDRANTVVAGLAWGGFLALAGFVALIVTMILHARWKVRSAIPGQIDRARRVLATKGQQVVDAPARAVSATHEAASETGAKVTSWTAENIEKAMEHLPSSTTADRSSSGWEPSVDAQAEQWMEAADQVLSDPGAGDLITSTAQIPADLLGRVGESLDRIEARVAAGDSLRAIARDERAVVEEAVKEVAGQAGEARQLVGDRFAATEEVIRERAAAEIGDAGAELADIGTIAFDDALAQVGDTGEELALGLTAVAGTAAAAGAAAVADRATNVADPTSPGSSTPLPPAPPPPPSPAGAATTGDADAEAMSSAPIEAAADQDLPDLESLTLAEIDALADQVLFGPDVAPDHDLVDNDVAVEPAHAAEALEPDDEPERAPLPEPRDWDSILAPPPAAVSGFTSQQSRGRVERESSAARAVVPGFSALAPPPVELGIRRVETVLGEDRDSTGDTAVASDSVAEPTTAGDGSGGTTPPASESPPTLAPPPDYTSLVHG